MVFSVGLLQGCGTVEADYSMPHEERTNEDPQCCWDGDHRVTCSIADAVAPSVEESEDSWGQHHSGESGSEPSLGLPLSELLMVVEEIWVLFYFICFLSSKCLSDLLLPEEEGVDLTETAGHLLPEQEGQVVGLELVESGASWPC